MAAVNPSLNSNSIIAVARRLDVGMSWVTELLQVEVRDMAPTVKLTEAAILFLEYHKEPHAFTTAIPHPGENNIFVVDKKTSCTPAEPNYCEPVAPAIMYAKLLRLSKDCFIIPIVQPSKSLTIQEEDGTWKPLNLMVASHFGVRYHFQKMEVTVHGIYLHHVWGIFVQ